MADNNDLKVIVGLNIPQSVVEIEDDLKIIEKTLAKSDEGKLKITAGLNIGKTIGIINKQLSELKIDGSRLKITPTLDISVGNQMAQQVNDQVNSAFSQIDFKHIAREIRDLLNIKKNSGIKEITKDIQTMYESFNVDPDKYKEAFNNILNWYQARSDEFILTEEDKVKQLNNLLSQLYNAPDRLTTLPKIATYTKDNPLIVTTRTLEEMKTILGNMEEIKRLFGEVQVDDVNGKLIGSFGQDWEPKEAADALRVYIEYLQKIQELRGRNRLTLDEYRSKDENEIWINQIEEAILKQYKFIDVGNRVAQINEQVAQSERDIAEAQREVQSAGGDQLSFNDQKTAENLEKTKELNKELIQGEKELVNLEKERTEIQNRLDQNRDAFKMAFEFDDDYDKLESAIKKDEDSLKRIEQEITNKTSANKVIKDQIEELSNQLREESQRVNQSAQNMGSTGGAGVGTSSEYLSSNMSRITVFANNAKEAEQSFKDLLTAMGDTKGVVVSKEFADATGNINAFTVAVKSGTGAFETFRYVVDEENDGFKLDNITAANAGIQRLTESTQKYYASMEATITTAQASAQKLKSTWSDTNGGKSVKDAEHLDSLKQKYAELMSMIEGLRGQSEIEAKQTIADIKAKEKEINSLIGTYHNAEKVATDLRTKGYETVREITGTKINTFEEKIKGALGSTEQLSAEMTNLRTKFESLNSATTQAEKSTILTSILDDLDKAKAKLENLKEVKKNFDDTSKSVNKVISDLDAMGRSQIFNTHSNNTGVIEFQGKIKGLSDTAKQVKADLNALGDSKAIPPELKTRVEDLKKKFDELNVSNKTLQANLRQDDGWAKTERQIQTLTARIKEYMATNTKAAKKYSSNFDGLLSGLSQAEINKDSEAVRRLSADFQILQHTIKAAGDQGKTLGQTIVDNVKRFSSWMTLTGVISTGWRELRKMVSTVIELDTAMTNLRKVTNETEGTYSKFLKNATTQAKELGMAVTDLIDSTSDFAKLGYSLPDATELAKVASVYANVGELNISDATSSLVSTLAAFKIEAKDAISVVDRLNAVGNAFSISSADIGEALQRSASSLHTANNTLDESIALITAAKLYWLMIWRHIYGIHLTALIA